MGATQPEVHVAGTGLEPLQTCQDQALAVSLAREAGELLSEFQKHAVAMQVPVGKLKNLGDAVSQEFLDASLRRERPRDEVLSEEAADNPSRLAAERVWIIDPLDGTREYSEGRNDWAVHVALWERGQLVAGAVALPGVGRMIGDGKQKPGSGQGHREHLRIAVSRTRPPECARRIAADIGAELVPMGSAGYKAWAVISGEADAYIHAGGQYEWDSAAPVFAARKAGLHASRIDGSPLLYNQATPYLPDLLLCRPGISGLLINAIGIENDASEKWVQTLGDRSMKWTIQSAQG